MSRTSLVYEIEEEFDDIPGDIDPVVKQKALELAALAIESNFIDIWEFYILKSKKDFYEEVVLAFETFCEKDSTSIMLLSEKKRYLFPKNIEERLVIYKEAMRILGEKDNYILRKFVGHIEHFIEPTLL
jgi:hypothetical protein